MPTGIYKRKPPSEETRRKISEAQKGRRMSIAARKNMSIKMKGRAPWNKGKKLGFNGMHSGGYFAIHKWLVYNFGKANNCENDTCKNESKAFQWALKHGRRYEYKRESFWMLCAACHKLYDMTPETRKKLRASKDKFKKRVGQYDLQGNLIREWHGVNDIVRELGINSGNLSSCLNNHRQKTVSGFVWRFI